MKTYNLEMECTRQVEYQRVYGIKFTNPKGHEQLSHPEVIEEIQRAIEQDEHAGSVVIDGVEYSWSMEDEDCDTDYISNWSGVEPFDITLESTGKKVGRLDYQTLDNWQAEYDAEDDPLTPSTSFLRKEVA